MIETGGNLTVNKQQEYKEMLLYTGNFVSVQYDK